MPLPSAGSFEEFRRAANQQLNPLTGNDSITPDRMAVKRFTYGYKERAYNRASFISMAQDLSDMVGYASLAGTTGGAGQTAYWVWRADDDASIPGTLRYAAEAAATGGGGQIFFDPRNELQIVLKSRIDVPSNCTIAAMGRNVIITAPSDTAMFNINNATNIIIRCIEFAHLINETGINNKLNFGDPGYDAQQGGPSDQADAIGIDPVDCDKIWIDQCTFQHLSDGAIDCSSSLLLSATVATCRMTVSRCIIRSQYKAMLCGSASLVAGDILYTNSRKVFATYYKNWFDHCGERMPRCAAFGYADCVNNIYDLCAADADDGDYGGKYGSYALYGGWVRSRGNLYRDVEGDTTTYAANVGDGGSVPEAAGTWEDSAFDGTMLYTTRNTGTITALPYTLVADVVPDAPTQRRAWRDQIIMEAGARTDAAPPGEWQYSKDNTQKINGTSVRAATDRDQGRYLLVGPHPIQTPQFSDNVATRWPRGGNLTIATDAITVDGSYTVHALLPESGSADTLSTINGGTADRVLHLRPSSSGHTITIGTVGNINISSSIALAGSSKSVTLRYDTGTAKWHVISSFV